MYCASNVDGSSNLASPGAATRPPMPSAESRAVGIARSVASAGFDGIFALAPHIATNTRVPARDVNTLRRTRPQCDKPAIADGTIFAFSQTPNTGGPVQCRLFTTNDFGLQPPFGGAR